MTRNPLQIGNLVPNRALQAAIEALAADAVPSRNPDAPAPMDPNEPEPVYPPINLQLEVTALPCQQLDSTLPADEMFVMTNIISPAMSERAPYDIVVCVDVSGSMGAEAQAGKHSSITLHNITGITHNQHTNIHPLYT